MKTVPIILAALSVPAAAVAAGPLQITTGVMVEQRAAAADGTTTLRLVAPGRIVPGDKVTLVLTYRNTGTVPLADVVLANQVPRGMTFRAALGTPVPEVSVDGTSFGRLNTLRLRAADGGVRAAGASDVKAVRWHLPRPIPAGAQGTLEFQAVLN